MLYHGDCLHVSFTHASCDYTERRQLWLDVDPFMVGHFLMIGDFNAVLGAHERRGRRNLASRPCSEFRSFIEDHDLIQPDSSGPFFTWTDRRRFPSPIESVLDKALFSQDFSDVWYSASALVLPRLGSDHSPILLRCQDTASTPAGHPFRFLNMWCSHEGFLDQIRASWSSPLDYLCPMGLSLLQEGIDEQGYTDDLLDQEVSLQARIDTILLPKSEHLRQQSRVSWLSDGDRNTRFFHSMVKWRRSNQTIKKLSIDGVMSEDSATMAAHVVHFYKDLFSEPSSGVVDRSWVSGYIPSSVTAAQSALLTTLPSADDIRSVVFSMHGNSAPGPDGFNGAFFHHSWEVVGEDMVAAVRRSLLVIFLTGSTPIFYAFFPRKRMRFLFRIIDLLFSECILLASEDVNCIERSIQGRNMALKVDIRKAFDTLSWEFVDVVLDSFGSPLLFRQWISVIFQSARISVLFKQHGFFSCSRGVRQGDHLSPILFALAEEVLSHLLLDAADKGFIGRMRMFRSLLFPSHLLYADDVLLFCKVDRRSCRMIESILQIYANVSGQYCNKAKSTVYFGKGVSLQLRRRLQRDLGFFSGFLPFVYLGVPVFAVVPLLLVWLAFRIASLLIFLSGKIFPDITVDIVSVPINGGENRRAWTHSHFGDVSSALAMDHAPYGQFYESLWVWGSLFTWFRVDGSSIQEIGSFIIWAMKRPVSKQENNLWRVGVMSAIWSLWNLRNKAIFDEAPVSVVALAIQVKAFILEASRISLGEMANSVEELLILHGLGVPGRPHRPTSYIYVFWLPPPHPWRKINIDGSVH
ncbi:uncharacterized protein LOC130998505 [Salvia miltiorrhiza]|uniref:uncharacterized protein LOC130998505 n=1 Tax=Salvia miltiorrhiza TaxID=226208 RepID=UPI0025AD3A24|nr:uncharacterized protein LOC130998505 [Salvia miltiorrhiza]